jgi:hypothetical protein
LFLSLFLPVFDWLTIVRVIVIYIHRCEEASKALVVFNVNSPSDRLHMQALEHIVHDTNIRYNRLVCF